ncbi:MAG: ATP-dependent DNA helicase RecG, partial [Candidatus Magasanikbacteria bacterium]|nr:ATP-dependent DNA helicase RecG [Candidatus Magasanikbacteria bacterium]
LKRLNIKNIGDLLSYFPFRYEDYRQLYKISELKSGMTATVLARVEFINSKRSRRRGKNITEAMFSDDSGSLRAVWFNQPFIAKNLQTGDQIYLSGKISDDMFGVKMNSPYYEKNKNIQTHTARMVPMYPLTHGITQKQMRFLIEQVLPVTEKIKDWIPEKVLEKFDLVPLKDSLQGIHFPKDDVDLKQSTDRLKFDELFLLQLKSEITRTKRTSEKAPKINFFETEIKSFVSSLPYKLTDTQRVSAWEILQDLQKGIPMNRLLSGDVGSGKTIVAGICLLNVVLNGYQGVLMAPTEILTTQHYDTLCKLLGDKVRIAILTNSQSKIINHKSKIESKSGQKKEVLDKIEHGEIDIIIGTHALLGDKVNFSKLGMVVVDEQHRFGVEQRKTIKNKMKDHPSPPPSLKATDGQALLGKEGITGTHFLSMTATPIPRSYALMVYGDLDISIISQMPLGRKKIMTRLVEEHNRQKAYEFIGAQVKQGRQVFVICPLIEDKQKEEDLGVEVNNYQPVWNVSLEKKSVMSEYEKLSKNIFLNLRVGYLHGKMKGEEKDEVMKKFKNKEIDILVSTSVVEVGIDIPNATVMMIEGAERFGLAQLHQFRGRVGRSEFQSYCFLFPQKHAQKVNERLKYFEKENNGFKLAEKDLEIRGPGDVYGKVQSGEENLRLAKLTDQVLIKKAREVAKEIATEFSKYPTIKAKFGAWEKSVHLE